MKSLAEDLPPEVAACVHPDWRKNEQDYWASRDALLDRYRNQWVAFADGAVIASGTSPVEVFQAAHQFGRHPFVALVAFSPGCRLPGERRAARAERRLARTREGPTNAPI